MSTTEARYPREDPAPDQEGPATATGVPAQPLWFGPPERSLFGWFHPPDGGRAAFGVVLCPPIGDEDRRVYRTFKKLAEALAGAGHAVLRFSYEGTGDSTGTLEDPDRVPAWTRNIARAASVLRDAGAAGVALVGMRLGATLATGAAAAMEVPPDALVLWDPCVTGREFLRHQQILLSTIPGRPSAGTAGADTPGYRFPPALVDELDRLNLVPVTAPSTRTLLLPRPDRPAPARLYRALGPTEFDETDAVGQAELLDVPPLDAAVPRQSIGDITRWISHQALPATAAVRVPARDEARVGTDLQGGAIVERATRLGPIGLFAVTTEPAAGTSGPWMMFVNVATEHHIGPGRLWVDLARHWARHGIRSVRFDLSGVGDSPVHPGQRENVTYAREWLDDLPALASAVSPGDPSDTVFVGLCSGGYGALEAGMAVGARGAYVFNPALSSASMNKSSGLFDRRRRAFRPLPAPLARLARNHGRTAWWIWRTYRQFAVWQAPMAVPATAVRAGLDVLVICGEDDTRPLREVLFWRLFGERRLRRTGRFDLTVVATMDHVLLFGDGRRDGARVLTDHVLSRFGTSPGRTEAATDDGAAVEAAEAVKPATGRGGERGAPVAR